MQPTLNDFELLEKLTIAKMKVTKRIQLELDLLRDAPNFIVKSFLQAYQAIVLDNQEALPINECHSLIAYNLGITTMDPGQVSCHYPVEPGSYPDIDTDYANPDLVKSYIREKYGDDKVISIPTYSRYKVRSLLKDLARVVLDEDGEAYLSFEDINALTKKLPFKVDAQISQDMADDNAHEAEEDEEGESYEEIFSNKDIQHFGKTYPELFKHFKNLYNKPRHRGKHAAGTIITPVSARNIIPLSSTKQVITAEYSEGQGVAELGALGFVKIDILGLKTLKMLDTCNRFIMSRIKEDAYAGDLPSPCACIEQGIKCSTDSKLPFMSREGTGERLINFNEVCLNIPKVYKAIGNYSNEGVFQLEPDGISAFTHKYGPKEFYDLALITSLYRPGPLDAKLDAHGVPLDPTDPEFSRAISAAMNFIERKKGNIPVIYPSPKVKDILEKSYGITCLEENTPINTSEGYMPIKNIKPGMLLLNTENNKITTNKVKNIWCTGISDTLEIKLKTNKSIICTENHIFPTERGDILAKDLKKWNYTNQFENNFLYQKWLTSKNTISIGEDLCYVIGMFLGDGSLKASSPSICCGPKEETALQIAQKISEVFGGKPKVYFGTRCWYAYTCIGNKTGRIYGVREKLNEIYGSEIWRTTKIKKNCFPYYVDLIEKERIALLTGLWDSDGCYLQHYFKNKSPNLIETVCNILETLKISYEVCDDISVRILDINRFDEYIKPKIINKLVNTKSSYFHYPALPINELLNIFPPCEENRILRRNLFKARKENRILYKTTKITPEFIDLYSKFYLGDYRLVAIKNINNHKKVNCYDLEMEDSNNPYFFANDILTHNCFQEQLSQMIMAMTNCNFGEAEKIRKFLTKIKPELIKTDPDTIAKINKFYTKFKEDCVKNGCTIKETNAVWNLILPFARYGFNKAHAVSYSLITYQTAFCRTIFPKQYLTALMYHNVGGDKLVDYIRAAQKIGLKILKPDINTSDINFSIQGSVIASGMTLTKGVADKSVENIIANRNEFGSFQSLEDFLSRKIKWQWVHIGVLEALVHSGTFDSIAPNRKLTWEKIQVAKGKKKLTDYETVEVENSDGKLVKEIYTEDYSDKEKKKQERESFGFNFEDSLVKNKKIIDKWKVMIDSIARQSKKAATIATINDIKALKQKNGQEYARISTVTVTGEKQQWLVFAYAWPHVKNKVQVGEVYCAIGKLSNDNTFIVDSVRPLENILTLT